MLYCSIKLCLYYNGFRAFVKALKSYFIDMLYMFVFVNTRYCSRNELIKILKCMLTRSVLHIPSNDSKKAATQIQENITKRILSCSILVIGSCYEANKEL